MNASFASSNDPALREKYDKNIQPPTPEDKMMLSFMRMHTMMDAKLEKKYDTAGMWGKIIADMFPYMGEFAMTGGVYTWTQRGVRKGLD